VARLRRANKHVSIACDRVVLSQLTLHDEQLRDHHTVGTAEPIAQSKELASVG
jgi:hypothetical protein